MGTTESIAVRGPPDPQPPRAEIHRSFLSCDPTCCDLPFCVTWILIRSPPRRSAPSNFLCLPPLVPNFPSMDSVYFRHKHHSHWNVLEKLHWFWNLSLSNISRIHTQTHIYPSTVPLKHITHTHTNTHIPKHCPTPIMLKCLILPQSPLWLKELKRLQSNHSYIWTTQFTWWESAYSAYLE